jgi:5'-3' exonuclease
MIIMRSAGIGSLDLLVADYKRQLPEVGYLTENGTLKLKPVEMLLSKIASHEREAMQAHPSAPRARPHARSDSWTRMLHALLAKAVSRAGLT